MSGEEGKMFVGGLSKTTTQQSMGTYFQRFGEVTECIVMRDPNTEASRGFGFVTFAQPSSVDQVLSAPPHILDGKQIDPKRCNPKQAAANRAQGGGMGMGGGRGMGGGMGGDRGDRLSKKIFVGGLPKEAKDVDVREHFSRFGRVTEAVVVVNPENRQSRCFGFVSFDSPDAVNQLTQLRFIDFNGKQVEIKCAEPREPSGGMMGATPQTRGPSGRGRGMGGGMGNGDNNGMNAPWGAMNPGAMNPGGAAMGQYPPNYPMAAPWAQQWAAMGWNPAAYQMGMPGAAAMPMTGMNMAGMNMAGMAAGMPMPVGPPTSGAEQSGMPPSSYAAGFPNQQNPQAGGPGMNNAGGDAQYGSQNKQQDDYARADRNSYHPYKR